MKSIKFNLTDTFKLIPITSNKVYELENNSCLLDIACVVDFDMAYELHVENSKGKFVRLLDKNENSVSTYLSSSMLSQYGQFSIQLRGAKDEYIIQSNRIDLEVLSFINASEEIAPEEEGEFEKLIIKVASLEGDIHSLRETKAEKGEVNGLDMKFTSMIGMANNFTQGVQNELHEYEARQSATNEKNHNDILDIGTALHNGMEEVHKDILDMGNELDNKADSDAVQGLGTRIDTLDNETLELYQKVERMNVYSSIPVKIGTWLGEDLYRRVYVVTNGIAKGNEIKVADKPSNMKFCPFSYATIVGASGANNVNTNSDCRTFVNNNGIFVVNNFTGYCERIYVTVEYTIQ